VRLYRPVLSNNTNAVKMVGNWLEELIFRMAVVINTFSRIDGDRVASSEKLLYLPILKERERGGGTRKTRLGTYT
jgi:hypothetical protein